MVSGHIATTFVAKRYLPSAPWWLLLAAAYGLDILMFGLVILGIERMDTHAAHGPGPRMSEAVIDMTYSHDLLPVLGWTLLFGAVVWLGFRNRALVVACMLLFFGHWVCDFFSGYGHFVFGPDSAPLGTDLYHRNLMAAILTEVAFAVACIVLPPRGTQFTQQRRVLPVPLFRPLPLSSLMAFPSEPPHPSRPRPRHTKAQPHPLPTPTHHPLHRLAT